MPMEPWDQLFDTIDHLAGDPEVVLDQASSESSRSCARRQSDAGTVDRELDVDDTARWLCAMLAAHRAAREAHPELSADGDGAMLRLIVTRWLHPHRSNQRDPRT